MKRVRDIAGVVVYVIMGYLFGFNAGRAGTDPISSFEQLLLYIAFGIIVVLLIWFEKTSQQRQMKNWQNIRASGKWMFVILRYVLARAIVLFGLLFLPPMVSLGPTKPLLAVLAIAVLILCPLYAYLGLHEWEKNEREFLADPIIKAARARIAESH